MYHQSHLITFRKSNEKLSFQIMILFTFCGLYVRWWAAFLFNYISVHKNPSLTLTSGTLTPQAGETVIFTCAASTSKTPKYKWQLNGSPLGGNRATYTLSNVSKDSSGNYTCTTTVSEDIKTSSAIQLNVSCKYRNCLLKC